MFLLLVFLSFVNFCVLDYFVWWSVFVMCTFVFIFFVGLDSVSCMVNYYIVQEICGYYFLVFDNWKFQFLILLMKSGSSPFHFWLFSVTSGLKKWFFLCFLTLQKLPYFPVLVNFCSDFSFFFLFFGMVFCYIHFFFLRSYMDMVVIGSTESFNWLLVFGIFFNEVIIFIFIYYLIMLLVISYVYNSDLNFFNLEMIFILFSIPLSITFFLKVLLLFSSFDFVGFYYFFLLLLMPLMSLGISYFFFMFSMLSYNYGLKYYDYLVYLIFCFSFFSVF